MNQEWLNCLMQIPLDNYETFIENTKLDMNLDLSSKFLEKDYSWLSIVERYLPFLKNTMDSSYFLLMEKDIQKNYDSRFLYTLFLRLDHFLQSQYEQVLASEKAANQSILHLTGTTSLEEEEIDMELSLKVKKKGISDKDVTVKERLEQVLAFLKPLRDSEFMNSMKGASEVRSPIRRTTLLAGHENFKKLLELFEFLDHYAMLEKALSGKTKKRESSEFFIPYFLNYSIFFQPNFFRETDLDFLKKYFESFIREFVAQSSMDDKTFKKMVNKMFEEEYAKKKNREKNIEQILKKSLDTHQKQMKDAIRILKG